MREAPECCSDDAGGVPPLVRAFSVPRAKRIYPVAPENRGQYLNFRSEKDRYKCQVNCVSVLTSSKLVIGWIELDI